MDWVCTVAHPAAAAGPPPGQPANPVLMRADLNSIEFKGNSARPVVKDRQIDVAAQGCCLDRARCGEDQAGEGACGHPGEKSRDGQVNVLQENRLCNAKTMRLKREQSQRIPTEAGSGPGDWRQGAFYPLTLPRGRARPSPRCPCGGIGRRSGFKIRRRKACRFESGHGYQLQNSPLKLLTFLGEVSHGNRAWDTLGCHRRPVSAIPSTDFIASIAIRRRSARSV